MTSISVIRDLFEIKSAGYRPSGLGLAYPIMESLGLPLFTIRRVEQMKFDPDVRLGMSIKYAPLLTVKMNVIGEERLANFYREEISRTWYLAMARILEALWYSRSGGEHVFKIGDDKLIHFDGFRDFYPADIDVLTRRGLLAGVKVSQRTSTPGGFVPEPSREADEFIKSGELILLSPKSFVFVHQRHFSTWNGKSDLMGCFSPWIDKWDANGALAVRRMWFYKNAYSGFFVQHPPGSYTYTDQNGQQQQVPYRDLARTMAEHIRTGAVYGVPFQADEHGNIMWQISQPEMNGDASGLHEWLKELRGDILHGLEIPDDIVTSVSESGSRAGRTIPFRAFVISSQQTVRALTMDCKSQLWDPMAIMNFGSDDVHVEAEVDIDRLMPDNPAGGSGDAIADADQMQGPDTRSRKKRAADQEQFSVEKLRPRHRRVFDKAAAAYFGMAGSEVRFWINGKPVDPNAGPWKKRRRHLNPRRAV